MATLRNKARLYAGQLLRALPMRSQTWGSPRYLAKDTEAWVAAQAGGTARFKLLRKSGTLLAVPDAHRLNPEDHDWFTWNRPWPQSRQFILHARGLRYTSWTGSVIGEDDALLEEFSPFHASPGDKHPLLSGVRLPTVTRLSGRSLLLSARNAGKNYYHWMNNLVPRKQLLDKAGLIWSDFDRVIVNAASHSYQCQILELWQVPPDKLFFSDDFGQLELEQAVAPSLAFQSGFDDDETHEYYQHLLLGRLVNKPVQHGRRLYIRRKADLPRAVLNEAELLPLLERHGFEVLSCEAMSLREQAETFAEATAVIAPHGAGLTNLVFMPPGGSLLEFFPRNYYCSSFWWICGRRGIRYSFLNSLPQPDNKPHPNQAIEVCTDMLANYLLTLST